jgi:sugar phosphate isomerase/epimerase
MKSSIIVPVQDLTSFSPFFPEDGLEVNLAKAAEAGYDGVELAITNPGRIDGAKIKRLLKRYNLSMPAVTTGQAYGIEGLSLIASDEGVRKRAIQRIEEHISLARELSGVVIIGLIRGKRGNKKAKELLIEALVACASFDPEVKLVLEPLNRYETELINTVDESLEILEHVGLENMGILFDTFHANIEEISIEDSIQKANGRIFHVHIADSNRWAPGYGHLDFKEISEALLQIDYQGFGSLESLPKPSPEKCLQPSSEFIKKL